MIIKQLKVENFKSFASLDIELNPFTILIGANAAGKSNFIGILAFLRNIAEYGLDNAISMEGGVDYLRNMSLATKTPLKVDLRYDPGADFRQKSNLDQNGGKYFDVKVTLREVQYEFSLGFYKRGHGVKLLQDRLTLDYEFSKIDSDEILGTGQVSCEINQGKAIIHTVLPDTLPFDEKALSAVRLLNEIDLPPQTLLLETPFFALAHQFRTPFEDIAIYDFDAKLPKQAVSMTGKTELEEDGHNLSLVLKNILEDKNKKQSFLNLLQDLLPFVSDVQVQRFAERSLQFTLKEKYNQQASFLPASFISDGTINLVALVMALYFEDKPLIIIEEPERNLHPQLISRVAAMFEEVSKRKQIIITTHNPEFVRHVALTDLFLVSRNSEGFSTILKPAETETVKIFLENEVGIEELYIQDLLGVDHAAT